MSFDKLSGKGESMRECPKCGHVRRQEDDGFVPAEECPKCGVIYSRARPDVSLQPYSNRPAGKGIGETIKFVLLIALVLIGFYLWTHYYGSSAEGKSTFGLEFLMVPRG